MAFIPNENGTEVTVLLLNAGHYHTSDGAAMQAHEPYLVARAGNCIGDCVDDDTTAAAYFFRDQSSSVALESLANALGNGSVWRIAGSDLAVQKSSAGAANLPALNIIDDVRGSGQLIPTTSNERRDFSWIARLSQLCGTGCTIDADFFNTIPPELVAARFKLNTGDLYTFSIARLGADVTPVHFKRLDGTGSTSSYVQAVASWVGADVQVTGDSVKFVETKYSGGTGRTMTLSPNAGGKVEVAVLNLPPFVPPATSNNDAPQVGKHFEMYYDLLQDPPATGTRLVPRSGAPSGTTVPQVSWSSVHPASAVYSDLLNGLRLDIGRSFYDRIICPPAGGDEP